MAKIADELQIVYYPTITLLNTGIDVCFSETDFLLAVPLLDKKHYDEYELELVKRENEANLGRMGAMPVSPQPSALYVPISPRPLPPLSLLPASSNAWHTNHNEVSFSNKEEETKEQEDQQQKMKQELGQLTKDNEMLKNLVEAERTQVSILQQWHKEEVIKHAETRRLLNSEQSKATIAQANKMRDLALMEDWQSRIATISVTEQAQLMRGSFMIKEASDQVANYEREWREAQLKADEALHKFVQSKKSMDVEVENFENLLTLMEQQVSLPESKCFNDLLHAVQHLSSASAKKKCFISYAWETDKKENTKIQAKLIQLKSNLTKAGIEVKLDIQNMEGDINYYMTKNIEQSDRLLLICTPQLKARIEEASVLRNNLQKEYHTALAMQEQNPKFIIPLIYGGDRQTSIPTSLPNILSLDFRDPALNREGLISRQPKGLIPMILGLDDNPVYTALLEWYQQKLQSVQTTK